MQILNYNSKLPKNAKVWYNHQKNKKERMLENLVFAQKNEKFSDRNRRICGGRKNCHM